jgi:hypothetical protein
MSTQTYATPSYSNIKGDNKPKSVAPHFDLNSLLNLQKNYAMNLDGINISGAEGQDPAIKNLNEKLKQLNIDINDSKIKANATLENQNAVNTILNTEKRTFVGQKTQH